MSRTSPAAVIAILALLAVQPAAAQTGQIEGVPELLPPAVGEEEVTPVLAQAFAAPRPAKLSDGTVELNYELELRVALRTGATLEALEVLDPLRGDAVIASLPADLLLRRLYIPGQKETALALAGGECGYLKVNLTFAGLHAVPRFLDHRFTMTAVMPPATKSARLVQRIGRTAVDLGGAPAISPPVAGDRWIAGIVGGDRFHRTTIMPINGRWVAPERWAVDWIRLDPAGRLASGNASRNEDFPQYRQPLLAVADGRVVKTRDGMPDQPPGSLPPNITLQEAAGNFVVLDIGRGTCAVYAHLVPGSLRVLDGQWVRRGQVLGLLGNSGNTTGPHLHFQVNDGCVAMASDGIPYVIDRFRVVGQVVSADELDSEMKHPEVPVTVVRGSAVGPHAHEMPANLSLISFPERGRY